MQQQFLHGGKTEGGDTESWLVDELMHTRPPPPPPPAAPSDDEDWGGQPDVPDPVVEGYGEVSEVRRELATATVELDRLAGRLRAEIIDAENRIGAHVVDEIRAHAKAMDRSRDSLGKALRSFAERLDRVEDQLGEVTAENEELRATLSVLSSARPTSTGDATAPALGLDLNRATFEDLQGAGFSSTQAARVLSQRDALGGFDSVDRVRQVPGLPARLLDRLIPLLRV